MFLENVKKLDTFSTFFVVAGGSTPVNTVKALNYAREPHSASIVWGIIEDASIVAEYII